MKIEMNASDNETNNNSDFVEIEIMSGSSTVRNNQRFKDFLITHINHI